MIIRKVIEAKRFIDGAKDMLEEKWDSTKAAISGAKEKLAEYNVKKVKALTITLGVISIVLSSAALAVAVVSLVKSCKVSRKSKVNDYSYYIDDPEDIENYSLGVDSKKIDESDLPDDSEE